MRLRILLLILTFLPALLLAQGQINLDFGDAGEREVWTGDQLALPSSTQKATEQTLALPSSGAKVFVWDRKTGNLAAKPVSEIKGTWKLTPADYQLVGKVVVRVEHDGKRVAVAFVKLKDAAGERESQIDATKNGEAVFFGVKPGNVEVTVKYVSKGADAEPAKQGFILKTKRSEPDPNFVVTLSQDVETVGGPSTEVAAGDPGKGSIKISPPTMGGGQVAPQQGGGGNVFMRILIYLIALGAAGAAIYFGLRYMKENQDKVKDQLQKVGVQIPDPQDPAQQDPGPVPAPIAPQPPQKIILDDADPSVPVAPTVTPDPIPSMAVSQPSLIMENGDVFPVPDGETTVGREAGLGLSLVTENTVSRRHATVVKSGNSVTVRDEGSSNGTFVNGVKIASDTVLRPGDQVQFGQAKFRYEA